MISWYGECAQCRRLWRTLLSAIMPSSQRHTSTMINDTLFSLHALKRRYSLSITLTSQLIIILSAPTFAAVFYNTIVGLTNVHLTESRLFFSLNNNHYSLSLTVFQY